MVIWCKNNILNSKTQSVFSKFYFFKKNNEIYCRRKVKVALFIEAERMVHRVIVHIGDQTFFWGFNVWYFQTSSQTSLWIQFSSNHNCPIGTILLAYCETLYFFFFLGHKSINTHLCNKHFIPTFVWNQQQKQTSKVLAFNRKE